MAQPSHYDQHPLLDGLALGKKSAYISQYTPTLLQPVPRRLNRDTLFAPEQPLPFQGVDIWNLYELSWLDAQGKPQVAIGEVRIAADSVNLIESKSFKLYLNSLNQTRFANWSVVEETLRHDLAACADGQVEVALYRLSAAPQQQICALPGETLDDLPLTIDDYTFHTDWLEGCVDPAGAVVTEQLHSHLLKSNCLVTGQPDWGSVLISYRGPAIDREALLRYLIGFREHNEFHEQCVERIFCDLMQYARPEQLTVYARYTRRGGLDINPYRSNCYATPDNQRLIRQ